MSSVDRRYGGRTGTERTAERRGRLVSAGLGLLTEKGIGGVTVTGVCAAAGLTERYFYESFPGRSELLDAIFDGISDSGVRAVLQAVRGAHDPASRAKALVEELLGVMAADGRLGRMARDQPTDEAVMRGRAATARRLAQAFEEHAHLFWDIDPGASARVRVRALTMIGGLADLLVAWEAGDLPHLSRSDVIDEGAAFMLDVGDVLRRGPTPPVRGPAG